MRVEDPPPEAFEDPRPDDPHVAGEDDHVRLDGVQRRRQRRVVAARDERGLDPLLGRPIKRRTGTIGEHEDDRPAELAATRRGHERAQVRAAARHTDRDPTAHPTPSSGAST